MNRRSFRTIAVVVMTTLLLGVVGVQLAVAIGNPTVTGVAPTPLGQGATNVDFVVNGTGFDGTGGAPTVTVPDGVTVTDVAIASPTQLTAKITITSSATVGPRNVTVSQGPAGVFTNFCTGCLTIAVGPTIGGAPSPSAAPNTGGPSVIVTVPGTNFATGAELKLSRTDFPDIVATSVNVNGPGTSISGTFDLAGQPAARWKVVVTNPNKGRAEFGDFATTGFLISGSTPTVSQVAPNTRSTGTTGTVLTLTGTNFARGATITFSENGGGEITATNPTWVSVTSYHVTVNVSETAATTARDVTLTNFDTQPGTCPGCFTVTGPPTVTDVSPNSRGQGAASQDLVVTGSNFQTTPTVTFSDTGITVNSTVRDLSTQLTVNISIAPGAPATARTMTVTNPDGGSDTATFTVNPGPTVSSATPASRGQNAQAQDIVITGTNFVNGAGLTVAFSGAGVTPSAPPTFTDAQHITAHIQVASDAATTARDVTVTNPDNGVGTGVGKLTVTSAPTISSLVPNALGKGVSNHSVVVNGANFVATPTIKFFNAGTTTEDAGITVNTVTRDSANQLTLDVSVSGADSGGSRDVQVTNPDAGNSTTSGAFSVTDAPTVDTITPTSAGQGATITGATITGTNFSGTPTITFSGAGVTASSVLRDNATHLTFTLSMDTNAAATVRNVTVTNPDFGSATKDNAFTVLAGPHITSITPNNGVNSGSTTITNLAGSGFASNAVVTLERNGFAKVDMNGETVTGGGTQITGSFPLNTGGPGGAPVAPGVWTVRVTNPDDNGTATLVNGFTVTSGAPTVTGASPNFQQQGTAVQHTITGTNFADGAVVTVSGTGVTAGTATVNSATTITVTLTATTNATLGTRNITVTNADSQAGTCTGCLTIRTNPTISSVNPTSRGQGTSHQSLAVNGTNFDGTTAVTFNSAANITVHSTTHNSAVLLTLDISIGSGAATTARDVIVTNSDQGTNTLVGGFTVNAGPTVSNLSPASRGQGVSHASVAVNGTNFVATPTVAFSGTGITVHSVTRNSAVLLTLDLSVDGAAATGARDVTVTNPDGGSVTSAAAFTVNSKPSTTSANPNSMVQGATGAVTLTGTNYVATPTVSFSGTGITVNTVTRDSLVQLTVNITIAGGASTGARNVTVTNPDGGTSTANGIFTVTGLNDPLVYQTFGDPIIGSPAIESNAPNTALAFWTSASNNNVIARLLSNNSWGAPIQLGGIALDGPGASNRGTNADVFVHGGDHAVYLNECNVNGCSGWQGLGGGLQGSPASVSWDSNRIDVFVRGNDNALWQRSWNGAWSPQWISLGGILTSSPTVTSTAVNRLTVAARGGDGAVWTQSFNGSSWSGWTSAGGQLNGAPALVAQSGNRIDLFVTGTDNRLYRSRNFGGFSVLGGILTSGPAAALMPTGGGNGVIEIGVRGGDGKLYLGQKAFP